MCSRWVDGVVGGEDREKGAWVQLHKEEEERDIKARESVEVRLVEEVEERGMRQASTRPAKGRQTVEGEMRTNFDNQIVCKTSTIVIFIFCNSYLIHCRPCAYREGREKTSRMSSTFRNIMSDVNYGIR